MYKKLSHLPLFEDFDPILNKISAEKKFEGIVVVDQEEDTTSDSTKDYTREIMTYLRNNDIGIYSNRMYSAEDGSAHIPIKHADAYDTAITDEFNKRGQKIRKILSKGGFSEFDTKFETDKIISGSTLWLTINPR